MQIDDELLTPTDLSRWLHKRVATLAVERCLRRDHPPYIKIGRRILYRRSAVEKWLADHVVNPAAAQSEIEQLSREGLGPERPQGASR